MNKLGEQTGKSGHCTSSMLSSGKGTVWAAKGGGGLWKKTCSRVFLSDKPDVMRVETQKNDLIEYQVERNWEGDIVTMAYEGERAVLWVCLASGCRTDMEQMKAVKFRNLCKDVYFKAHDTQGSTCPRKLSQR